MYSGLPNIHITHWNKTVSSYLVLEAMPPWGSVGISFTNRYFCFLVLDVVGDANGYLGVEVAED
jgi:hypothetical protein